MKTDFAKLEKLCRLIRYDILASTTKAGSGHPTSSLSAVELMTTLFFNGFLHYDLDNPSSIFNDRVIFSKGHAAPLLYSLYHAAGALSLDELLTLRTFDSDLEGHPTPRFKFVDVATGSLGQGLSMGIGMSLGLKLHAIGGSGGRVPDSVERSEPWREGNPKQNLSREPKIFVLLGDSEMAEGQIWEAMEIASYYKLNNLIGLLDVSRLGQQSETMIGWNIEAYAKRAEAFGWKPVLVDDGHDLTKVKKAFELACHNEPTLTSEVRVCRPVMIIAKTIKGKGISLLENKEEWHGKTLDKDQLKLALKELGKVDLKVRGSITKTNFQFSSTNFQPVLYRGELNIDEIKNKLQILAIGGRQGRAPDSAQVMSTGGRELSDRIYRDSTATREAYGDALVNLGETNQNVVVLDAEMANSTFENKFQKRFPERFFEMFIEEQNMISAALGMSKMGWIPYCGTFAAFLTRAYDQIRMAQYSNLMVDDRKLKIDIENRNSKLENQTSNFQLQNPSSTINSLSSSKGVNLKIIGSHAGVSMGPDGASQMGLEDISMMRSILDSTVVYPSDAVSAYKLTHEIAKIPGISYMRLTRKKTPVIYKQDEEFPIGGLKIHKSKILNITKKILIISAGITLHEALKAQKELAKKKIETTVVDLYSIKPMDEKTIRSLAQESQHIIVVEDHYPTGGMGEAVLTALMVDDRKWKVDKENRRLRLDNQASKFQLQNPSSIIHHLSSRFTHLCVRKLPHSGSPKDLLRYEEIDAGAICKTVVQLF